MLIQLDFVEVFVNKFLSKVFACSSLVSSIFSVSNICSALREFSDWFYGEGEFPEDKKEWFAEEIIERRRNFVDACAKLGKDFSEDNKLEVKECMLALVKFVDALYVRKICLFDLLKYRRDLFDKVYIAACEDEKIFRSMPWEVENFLRELEKRWVKGSFGVGF